MAAWMIYGASGYTGRLVAGLAAARGHTPVLAGRNAQAILAAAQAHNLPAAVFPLTRPAVADRQLQHMTCVLNCAGPFSETAKPLLESCLRTGTHYLDITGELDVLEAVFARDAELRTAGIAAIPGVGFDVVPTDCLAALLKQAMPDALVLRLAFHQRGGHASPGTLKTLAEGLGQGNRLRRAGSIVAASRAGEERTITMLGERTPAVLISWGDVSTAYHSTGIPNIAVYMAANARVRRYVRWSRLLQPVLAVPLVQALLKSYISRHTSGPDDATRAASSMLVWGETENADGDRVHLQLSTPDGYTLTAESAVRAIEHVLAAPARAGALTPSQAFGADFALSLPGVLRHD